MKRSLLVLVFVGVVLLGSPVAVCADEPPPLPTLVPPGDITDQVYQLQQFQQVQAYNIQYTTAYTATVGGATWAIERRFSYGEAGITIMLMAVSVLLLFDLLYKVTVGTR